MKKLFTTITTLVIAMALLFTFSACNKDKDTIDQDDAVTGQFKWEIVETKVDTTEVEYEDDGTTVKVDEYGRTVYKKEDKRYYKITGYTVSSEDAIKINNGDYDGFNRALVIPADYKGLAGATEDLPVEEIERAAFANQVLFTSVKVGENIKTIGEGSFNGLINLTEIELPFVGKSVDAVNKERLFGHIFGSVENEGSTSVTGVYHNFYYDGANQSTEEKETFYIPSNLTKVVIKGNAEEVSESAFYGMTTLKDVVLPSTVVKFGAHAFSGCTSLVNINTTNVEYYGDYSFNGCTALRKVDFTNAKVIGEYAFNGCTKFGYNVSGNNEVIFDANLLEIQEKAFMGCSSLNKVDLTKAKGVTVRKGAFHDSALSQLSVSVLSTFDVYAFNGCALSEESGVYFEDGSFENISTDEAILTLIFGYEIHLPPV